MTPQSASNSAPRTFILNPALSALWDQRNKCWNRALVHPPVATIVAGSLMLNLSPEDDIPAGVATLIQEGLNHKSDHPGCLILRDGSAVPYLVPKQVSKPVEAKRARKGEARRATVKVPSALRKQSRSTGPRRPYTMDDVAEAVYGASLGRRLTPSFRDPETGMIQCMTNANFPTACKCGGKAHISRAKAIIQPNGYALYFGPACAEALGKKGNYTFYPAEAAGWSPREVTPKSKGTKKPTLNGIERFAANFKAGRYMEFDKDDNGKNICTVHVNGSPCENAGVVTNKDPAVYKQDAKSKQFFVVCDSCRDKLSSLGLESTTTLLPALESLGIVIRRPKQAKPQQKRRGPGTASKKKATAQAKPRGSEGMTTEEMEAARIAKAKRKADALAERARRKAAKQNPQPKEDGKKNKRGKGKNKK